MTEYTIAMIVCCIQIILSIILIIRQKNVIVILSEITSHVGGYSIWGGK